MEIQRRAFLGGAVAAMAGAMVPTMRLRPEVDLHRLAGMWVDSGNEFVRYALNLPFAVDGMSYATDGRGMARIVASVDDINRDEQRRLPDVIGCWETLWNESKWSRLPDERLVQHPEPSRSDYGECPQCTKDGAIIECPHCCGVGESEFGATCPQCRGEGVLSNGACVICRGRPYGPYAYLQPLGGQLVNCKYVRKIRAIPGVMWCQSKVMDRFDGKPWSPILFRSDVGIAGIVMPVCR